MGGKSGEWCHIGGSESDVKAYLPESRREPYNASYVASIAAE
jgi:hypothetical protein